MSQLYKTNCHLGVYWFTFAIGEAIYIFKKIHRTEIVELQKCIQVKFSLVHYLLLQVTVTVTFESHTLSLTFCSVTISSGSGRLLPNLFSRKCGGSGLNSLSISLIVMSAH